MVFLGFREGLRYYTQTDWDWSRIVQRLWACSEKDYKDVITP
jgi:hypothetical protein